MGLSVASEHATARVLIRKEFHAVGDVLGDQVLCLISMKLSIERDFSHFRIFQF